MQINGLGNSHNNMHHVTNCIHDQKYKLEGKVGGANAEAASTTQQVTTSEQSGETFSLSAWLQNTLSGAKRLLGKIWGSETAAVQGDVTAQTGAETLSEIVDQDEVEVVSPYFTAVPGNVTSQQNIWQKIKVRVQNITGFLAKRFSFSNSSSFQTRQERPKEDLSRHSRYREDEREIDCIITDDSYLMDSYNKKGEYSKLSAGK